MILAFGLYHNFEKKNLDKALTETYRVMKKGAKICYQKKKKYKKGYFFSPVIIDNVDSSMKVYNNETFGPLFTIFSL